MISSKKYEGWLNKRFLEKNKELFINASKWKSDFEGEQESDDYRKMIQLLDNIEVRYGFNMQKMCRTNFQLLSLFQIAFQRKIDGGTRQVALQFLIACCLIDKLLDSKRYRKDDQLIVVEKMTSQWGTNAADNDEIFSELDNLLFDVRSFLDYEINLKNREYFHGAIMKAYTSEIYMWEHMLLAKEKMEEDKFRLLTDKSVEFEKAALLLSLGNNISAESVKAAEVIAEITWLADDLCDFIDDIRCRRKNSLLFISLPEKEFTLEERAGEAVNNMEKHVKRLENAIETLKCVESDNLYYFVVNLVWKWFEDVRKNSDKA